MFVGHFGVAFVAKRAEPSLSLGTLVLAAMLADLLWTVFMMVGVEQVAFKPGMGAVNYFDAVNIAMSHSLLMDAIWAAVFAAVYYSSRHRSRAAWILFAAVLSHWVLDVVSHRPDMPLAPGVPLFFGWGLWTSVPATLVVEGGFWLIAVVLYARAARPEHRVGIFAFWIGVALLTLLWHNNIAGPPPPPRTAPLGSLIVFSLALAWAYWVDRLRPLRNR